MRNHGILKMRTLTASGVILMLIGPAMSQNHEKSAGLILALEAVSTFNLRSQEFAEAGMGFGPEFDVDDSGNIYYVAFSSKTHWIYKVSADGKLLLSFGRIGQGPGELGHAMSPAVLSDGRLAITDRTKKIVIYDSAGRMEKEVVFNRRFSDAVALKTGGFLIQRSSYDRNQPEYIKQELVLLDRETREIKVLDSLNEHRDSALYNRKCAEYFIWEATADRIYSMSEDRGYEVLVHDHQGNLLKKITGKPRPIKATEEIMRFILGPGYGQPGQDKYFPNPMPPVNHFFVDDEGHVFAMTYAKDPKSGFYVYDIFNRDGACIGSQGIQTIWARQYFANMGITAKKGKLYCWREDQDGDWEFIIQKIKWLKD